MNRSTLGDDHDRDPLPDTPEIETLLLATRVPGPSDDHRDRVLGAMEVAATERRSILAAHRPTQSDFRARVLPEAIAGAAAALCVLVAPWLAGERGSAVASPAPEVPRVEVDAEDAPDVHLALELLAARRDRFAGMAPAIATLGN